LVLPALKLLLCTTATPVVIWMGCVPIFQLTVTAAWSTLVILLLMGNHGGGDHLHTTDIEEAACSGPNVSKALAIVALIQTTFGLVTLYLNNYAARGCYFE
jgi:hypothetical protein